MGGLGGFDRNGFSILLNDLIVFKMEY